jgi:hypothetical protein
LSEEADGNEKASEECEGAQASRHAEDSTTLTI